MKVDYERKTVYWKIGLALRFMKILPRDYIYLPGPKFLKAPLHQIFNIFNSVKRTCNPIYFHAP